MKSVTRTNGSNRKTIRLIPRAFPPKNGSHMKLGAVCLLASVALLGFAVNTKQTTHRRLGTQFIGKFLVSCPTWFKVDKFKRMQIHVTADQTALQISGHNIYVAEVGQMEGDSVIFRGCKLSSKRKKRFATVTIKQLNETHGNMTTLKKTLEMLKPVGSTFSRASQGSTCTGTSGSVGTDPATLKKEIDQKLEEWKSNKPFPELMKTIGKFDSNANLSKVIQKANELCSRLATEREVNKAFGKISMVLHPDRCLQKNLETRLTFAAIFTALTSAKVVYIKVITLQEWTKNPRFDTLGAIARKWQIGPQNIESSFKVLDRKDVNAIRTFFVELNNEVSDMVLGIMQHLQNEEVMELANSITTFLNKTEAKLIRQAN